MFHTVNLQLTYLGQIYTAMTSESSRDLLIALGRHIAHQPTRPPEVRQHNSRMLHPNRATDAQIHWWCTSFFVLFPAQLHSWYRMQYSPRIMLWHELHAFWLLRSSLVILSVITISVSHSKLIRTSYSAGKTSRVNYPQFMDNNSWKLLSC